MHLHTESGELVCRSSKQLKQRSTHSDQGAFGDPENPDMTIRDFVEKCEQFEDELCTKYGVKRA